MRFLYLKRTAVKADGGLNQLSCMPFGITNAVTCFQKSVDNFISDKRKT